MLPVSLGHAELVTFREMGEKMFSLFCHPDRGFLHLTWFPCYCQAALEEGAGVEGEGNRPWAF